MVQQSTDAKLAALLRNTRATKLETADLHILDEREQLQENEPSPIALPLSLNSSGSHTASNSAATPETVFQAESLTQKLTDMCVGPLCVLLEQSVPEPSPPSFMVNVRVWYEHDNSTQVVRVQHTLSLQGLVSLIKHKAAQTGKLVVEKSSSIALSAKDCDLDMKRFATVGDVLEAADVALKRKIWRSWLDVVVRVPAADVQPSSPLSDATLPSPQSSAGQTQTSTRTLGTLNCKTLGVTARVVAHETSQSQESQGQKRVLFVIVVGCGVYEGVGGEKEWQVRRRFGEFQALHKLFSRDFDGLDFPRATARGGMLTKAQVEQRVDGLDRFIAAVLSTNSPDMAAQRALMSFLEVAQHLNLGLTDEGLTQLPKNELPGGGNPHSHQQQQQAIWEGIRDSKPVACGSLAKRSRINTQFRWRYFQLYAEGYLTCFASPSALSQPVQMIRLTRDHFVADCMYHVHGFQISNTKLTVHLAAATMEDKLYWMYVIAGVISKSPLQSVKSKPWEQGISQDTSEAELTDELPLHMILASKVKKDTRDRFSTMSESPNADFDASAGDLVFPTRATAEINAGADGAVTTTTHRLTLGMSQWDDSSDDDDDNDGGEEINTTLNADDTSKGARRDSVSSRDVFDTAPKEDIVQVARRASERAVRDLSSFGIRNTVNAIAEEEDDHDPRITPQTPAQAPSDPSQTMLPAEFDVPPTMDPPKHLLLPQPTVTPQSNIVQQRVPSLLVPKAQHSSARPPSTEAQVPLHPRVAMVLQLIHEHGYCNELGQSCIRFGDLFSCWTDSFLVGALRNARRQKLVAFEGDMLWYGIHNKVLITLLQDTA